jgi:hypothetical protein
MWYARTDIFGNAWCNEVCIVEYYFILPEYGEYPSPLSLGAVRAE